MFCGGPTLSSITLTGILGGRSGLWRLLRSLNDEEILRVIVESERDHVLDFYVETFGPDNTPIDGCSWIPPEERQREAEAEKESRRFSEKWHEKKTMQENISDE